MSDTTARVAARLKAVCLIQGINHSELARRANLPYSVVANITSGRKGSVTLDELVALSEALKVSPGELDERLVSSEARARREDYRASLAAQIVRLQGELEAVAS